MGYERGLRSDGLGHWAVAAATVTTSLDSLDLEGRGKVSVTSALPFAPRDYNIQQLCQCKCQNANANMPVQCPYQHQPQPVETRAR